MRKESNNLDDASVLGIDPGDYLEYENLEEFYEWVLTLKPKDVRDKGISQQALYKIKAKIRKGQLLNFNTKVIKKLRNKYTGLMLNNDGTLKVDKLIQPVVN
ncbi:MAG: hypothetical protein QXQ39_04405 [Conexivisphaerales archaeon]